MTDTGENNGKLNLSNRYFSFGIQVAGSFAFYLLGGYWLDTKFSTLPLFLIIGILFGAISFIYFMRKLYRQE